MTDSHFLNFKRSFNQKHRESINKILERSPMRSIKQKESNSSFTMSTFVEPKQTINGSEDFVRILNALGLSPLRTKDKVQKVPKALNYHRKKVSGNFEFFKIPYSKKQSLSPSRIFLDDKNKKISPLRTRKKSAKPSKTVNIPHNLN